MNNEICNECGQSVKFGSGRFVNRIPDLNDTETRVEMGKPFPEGDFLCAICDDKLSRSEKKWTSHDESREGNHLIHDETCELIAEVYNYKYTNLIKSAPDLLEALNKIKELTKMNSLTIGGEETNISCANHIAEQAIKKAE